MRVNQGQEFVIAGYTPSPKNFDALVIGYYEADDSLLAYEEDHQRRIRKLPPIHVLSIAESPNSPSVLELKSREEESHSEVRAMRLVLLSVADCQSPIGKYFGLSQATA